MTTGRLPFESRGRKLALNLTNASVWNPGLPAGMDALILEALQPDPSKRLASAALFLSRLKALTSYRS